MNLALEPISTLRARLRGREICPRDILAAIRERVEELNLALNAYVHHDWDAAMAEADRADLSLPLGGIPVAIKDVISVRGQPCTCGSRILQGHVALYDATVIGNLRRSGAIPVGRLNMDEFAMGSSNENSFYGPCRNPWDTSRAPGGSSGGSAAAVAAGLAVAALGSDTGGSIRQPAAFCGCVGLKPTYGRVSRYGLVAFASSLDQIGPLTRTVEDAAIVLGAISGHDPADCTSVDTGVPDFAASLGGGVRGLRFGVPKEYFIPGMDPAVERAVRAAIDHLAHEGAEIVEISLPHTEHAIASYYIIAPAEASSNLARFDGVRYGHRAKDATDVIDCYAKTRQQGFGKEVKRRILLGTYVLSSGYYDAYYLRAQKVRTLMRRDFERAFETCDAILTPTAPSPAFKLGEKLDDPISMYLGDVFTIAVNMAGICGISLPCGFTGGAGARLPIGLQIIGKPFDEATILRVAHHYEQTTPWHRERPPL
ncbi:MAG TPA: Asp-tRNA(Asn)/Glu-tRNA(Gln) amidotransferase subunit GatA [Verrucomicrobiae bacterium]|nr:Asp-tRNA(Asn)/Glu-tRNA(Gln) amidotransferase subunit GatA [Verrucomicrobiae bacterium]